MMIAWLFTPQFKNLTQYSVNLQKSSPLAITLRCSWSNSDDLNTSKTSNQITSGLQWTLLGE